MTKEQIDRCLGFAEGNKGKLTIRSMKKPDFPNTLIKGTEKQRLINEHAAQGLSTRKIGELIGCTHATVVEHMANYKRNVVFYDEWCEFWAFIENVRNMPVEDAFEGVLSEKDFETYRKKGVMTVGAFLMLTVTQTNNQWEATARTLGLSVEQKRKMFERMSQLCYELLTVSCV